MIIIKNIVEKYSNHIAYPIFLNYDEEVTQELSEEDKKAGIIYAEAVLLKDGGKKQ